jgi:transcriptional regulator with XRE-family HTH domain
VSRLQETIRARRKELGLTLEEVAEIVGVTAGALSHIESGRRLPDPRNAVAIAQALQMDPDQLLALLDDAHADRNAVRSGWGPSESRRASAPRGAPRSAGVFSAMSIDAMFSRPDEGEPEPDLSVNAARYISPEMRHSNVSSASPRDRARYAPNSTERLRAAEELADEASRAIRTLRGMLDDEDPDVAREARRLLRELDVRGDE